MTAIAVRSELDFLVDDAHPLVEPDGVPVVQGTLDGHAVVAFRVDAPLGVAGCERVLLAVRTAVAIGAPVVGVWETVEPDLAEGVAALDAIGRVARELAGATVPRLTVGLPRGVSALADFVGDAARVRTFAALLAGHDAVEPRAGQDLRALLPRTDHQVYDVKPLIRAIVDTDARMVARFAEVRRDHAPAVVTGLARLGGRTVGVVAANPIRGRLDGPAAEKTAAFVRTCDRLGIAIVVLVDAPHGEWDAEPVVSAFAEAGVPRVTLITRKAYGDAYVALNSRSLGATAVYAWPGAECAVMPAKAAVRLLRRDELAAAPLTERAALLARFTAEERAAAALGGVDAVIDPAETGRRIADALRRGTP